MGGRGGAIVLAVCLVWCAVSAWCEGAFLASSIHPPQLGETYDAAHAFDGDPATRWASQATGTAWVQVDFGKPVALAGLRIHWEHAYALEYAILVSPDGRQWTEACRVTDGKDEARALTGLDAEGRYLRIRVDRSALGLASIWEVSFTDPAADQAVKAMVAGMAAERQRREEAARRHFADRLANLEMDEVVYATRAIHPDGHWYANIGYYGPDENRVTWRTGGGLYKYSLRTKKVTPLIEDGQGTIRDPAVGYDGRTILFAWRKGDARQFHLYTIQADGTGLKQLTFGDYDDFEPSWLPDGGIAFASTRCRRWVQCWLTQVAVVHRMNADGSGIEPLSANLEHDNTPWPLADGRILYTRWEYVDRSQVDYHHLWTMNPDGTGEMAYFGNMHPGGVYIDAKPVPGTDEVLMVHSPGHGAQEHAGQIALVHVKNGPDDLGSMTHLTSAGYRDPYAVNKDLFLAARGDTLVMLDREGNEVALHRIEGGPDHKQLHEPRPLLPRAREHVIPARANPEEVTGRVVLANAYEGRNMTGVERGDIRKLLVVEALPKPINYTGGMDPISYGGTFTLERILGTVPVEDDGSAYAQVPANRALFFVAQDEAGMSVKRMQSFFSVMPGETLSCVGCHEQRSMSGQNPMAQNLMAVGREPSVIEPIRGIPEVFDFPRDIQPILDRHCLPCHDYTRHDGADQGPRAGGVILSGDRGPMFSHSYVALTIHHQIADGRDQAKSNYPPRSLGAVASPLMHKLLESHHGVQPTPGEIDYVRYWLESGAAYPGTYGALGGGSIGGYRENQLVETDANWPETGPAMQAIANRCAACHTGQRSLPRNLSDENALSFWRPDWNDPRLKYNRHLLFNLSEPAHSLCLLAPLAREAGGLGLCGETVFASTEDEDYQRILALTAAGKRRLEEITRFDMPGFRPPAPYIREMKRFGVLAEDFEGPADPYACDRAYWRSFDQEVALDHAAYRDARAE